MHKRNYRSIRMPHAVYERLVNRTRRQVTLIDWNGISFAPEGTRPVTVISGDDELLAFLHRGSSISITPRY